MNKFIAIAVLVAALTGCATAPTSSLPMVDVSKIESGKQLTASEIEAAVRGKQMIGNVVRVDGSKVQDFGRIFEASGALKGVAPGNDWDTGKWHIDQKTNMLCHSWTRWPSSCSVVSVRGGKLHMLNPASGGVYLQQ